MNKDIAIKDKSIKALTALTMSIKLFSMHAVFATSSTLDGSSQLGQAISNIEGGVGPYAVLKEIMGLMAWFAFAIAVFKMIQIGILFLTGTAGKRGGAKDALLPWFVGAIICVMFGVIGPWVIDLFASSAGDDIFAQ